MKRRGDALDVEEKRLMMKRKRESRGVVQRRRSIGGEGSAV